ncbi:MAG: preprotein translocase subunit SecY [Rickettsiales bacterium]|nr:preprotein translocase subunit SecY [Rickettsiales bacterium]
MDTSTFLKAHDLKRRIVFTLFVLVICRLGSYVTIPGIDITALSDIASANAKGILGMFNVFSGGSLSRMSIFALSIIPYITSSIIIQLFTVTFPYFEELKKDGGREKINQYTRYLTVVLAAFQAYGMAIALEKLRSASGDVVTDPGSFFRFSTILSLVVGTMFLMWLGDKITSQGVGNGTSLIIFIGIVTGLPQAFTSVFELVRTGGMSPVVLILLLLSIFALVYFIIFMERAQRRILVNYPRRQIGNKIFGGDSTHLPLKLNTAGVIPPIFASSILLFPLTITNFISTSESGSIWESIALYLGRGKPLYLLVYVALVMFFCFFYTSVVFNVKDTAEMLKKNGGFIHGRRPGEQTASYLDHVLTRLTVIGALYIAFVCALPEYVSSRYAIPFYLGGTSFLIVVNVVIDTFSQIQTEMFSYQYEGLIKKSRLRRG